MQLNHLLITFIHLLLLNYHHFFHTCKTCIYILDEDFSDIIPDIDVAHLLFCLHKLTSLKILAIVEGNLLQSVPSLLPQHCPSLSTITVSNSVFFHSLVVPNFNTLTSIKCSLTSTDLSSLCIGLQQTRSLKVLQLDIKLNTYEEVEVLGCALKQNRSLNQVIICCHDAITLDGIELLKQTLSCHVEKYMITCTDATSDDDNMKLVLAMSPSMAALEYKEEETHASLQMKDISGDNFDDDDDYDDDMKLALAMCQLEYKEEETHAAPQENHISGDDDMELALAMSLLLKTAEEEHRKRDEEKEDLEHALRLSLDNN